MKRVLILLSVVFLVLSWTVMGKTVHVQSTGKVHFKVDQLYKSKDVPWGMVFISSNKLLFTEQGGTVKILDVNSGSVALVGSVSGVRDRSQGGLMDAAVPPGFKTGDWIYFTYSKTVSGGAATTLARAKYQNDKLSNWQDLIVTRSVSSAGVHYGSRIAFDEKGYLFFTIGDRGTRDNAQNLTVHAGSVLRVNYDGTVPNENPFVEAGKALPEIWSYGHRNPQGIVYDAENDRLWAIEHGPRGGDEINLIRRGRNYGWPIVSHGKEYWGPISVGEGTEKEGMENPTKVYIPSIAPSSLMLYNGDAFPGWRGNLFAGALAKKHINRIVLDSSGNAVGEERLLTGLGERIRSLTTNSKGEIFFSTDSGKILRMSPN